MPLPALAGLDTLIAGATLADKIATCNGYGQVNSYGDFSQTTRSLAGYAQVTFKLLPNLDLTGGIRYTDEKKTGNYNSNFLNPTGRLFATTEKTDLDLKSDRVTYRANWPAA